MYALFQGPALAFADGGHAVLDVELRFAADEFLDGLDAHRAVEVRVKLLLTVKTLTLALATAGYIYSFTLLRAYSLKK